VRQRRAAALAAPLGAGGATLDGNDLTLMPLGPIDPAVMASVRREPPKPPLQLDESEKALELDRPAPSSQSPQSSSSESSRGGARGTLLGLALAVVVAALVGGGVWWFVTHGAERNG